MVEWIHSKQLVGILLSHKIPVERTFHSYRDSERSNATCVNGLAANTVLNALSNISTNLTNGPAAHSPPQVNVKISLPFL